MLIHFLEVVVKVAVIGAGISGLGASVQLTHDGVEHIIIEGRDRIGGRITPAQFDGIPIELGAAFIHMAVESNRINQIVQQQGWNFTEIGTGASFFSYEGLGVLNETVIDDGFDISDQACTYVLEKQANTTKALNLKEAAGNFFTTLSGYTPQAVDTGKWFYDLLANYNGAKLTDVGTDQCQMGTIQGGDYLPDIGFSNIISFINTTMTKPKQVYFGQKVKKIDYSGDKVKVYTDDKVYIADKVISSLPLGVLKSKSVEFQPKLSQDQSDAIEKLGNGIYNKVFASFEEPFWDTSVEWVDFITKDNKKNSYSASRQVIRDGNHFLCFFVSADHSQAISKFSNDQLRNDLSSFLKRFFPQKNITIKSVLATSWHLDEFSLGSYSFQKVGTNATDLILKACAPLNNKVWFVGEHCHSELYSFSHGAFETGVWAAENAVASLTS